MSWAVESRGAGAIASEGDHLAWAHSLAQFEAVAPEPGGGYDEREARSAVVAKPARLPPRAGVVGAVRRETPAPATTGPLRRFGDSPDIHGKPHQDTRASLAAYLGRPK